MEMEPSLQENQSRCPSLVSSASHEVWAWPWQVLATGSSHLDICPLWALIVHREHVCIFLEAVSVSVCDGCCFCQHLL